MLNSTIVVRLLIAIAIITLVTLVSQSSQRLAGIISTMPVNITVGLWVVYSVGGSRPQATAPLALAMLWGLIPTMLFTATCWYLLRRG
ncbi:MAG TPA: hypothetical protein VER55_11920 [Ardenticatenaceae bacterium]|nr:hypothetical protein [Ardenticatenaceae bacterium]